MKIYLFGNPLIKKDSLPLKLLPKLKIKFPQIDFIAADPNEDFPPVGEKNIIILDTVIGIKEPKILDLDDFQTPAGGKTPISPHDYDLLFHLLLLKKIKRLDKVKIIGLPLEFRGGQSNKSLYSIIEKIQ